MEKSIFGSKKYFYHDALTVKRPLLILEAQIEIFIKNNYNKLIKEGIKVLTHFEFKNSRITVKNCVWFEPELWTKVPWLESYDWSLDLSLDFWLESSQTI
jgi:hypothetical protein